MKVFVARALAAPEPSDFHHALDGELVMAPLVPCSIPSCGCRRSVVGIASGGATTMFTVAELSLTFTEYVAALRDGRERQGWWRSPVDDEWLLGEALVLARAAATLPSGVALRLDGDSIRLREVAA